MAGLLLLDKPEGITSYGAVAVVKRLTGQRRVGHTGTLDPMATGVLPILLGRATALSSYLLEADKGYTATVRLGVTTDTCDITGNVISQRAVEVTDDDIENVLCRFKGIINQTPPMFSALKKDGVRLYDLARKGIEVDIPQRQVEVYSLQKLSSLDENREFTLRTRVSKGTYIRSLCRDIGNELGCGAMLSQLRRDYASGFSAQECTELSALTPENVSEHILSPERAVDYMPRVNVTLNQAKRFLNGGWLDLLRTSIKSGNDGELFRVGYGELFLGLGRLDLEKGQLTVKCVIAENSELL